MAQVSVEGDDYTMLSATLNREANVLEFPADHDIWHATQARSNILRCALSAKAGRTHTACSVKEMLSSSSFRERFAQGKKNINEKKRSCAVVRGYIDGYERLGTSLGERGHRRCVLAAHLPPSHPGC